MGLSTFDTFKNVQNENLIVLTEQQIRALQNELIHIVDDINAVCLENKIVYSLAGGSVLGAIRHGGFIPWDDDFDILMTRDNYQKFCNVFSQNMEKKYWLHTPEKTKNHGLGLAQIRKKGTVYRSKDDYRKEECGVCVDIFIIENTYDNKIFRCLHGILSMGVGFLYSCRNAFEKKEVHDILFNHAIPKIIKIKIAIGRLLSFLSLDKWTRIWNNINSMCHNSHSQYVSVPVGRNHFFKELYERNLVCKVIEFDFEFDNQIRILPIMEGYDYYLNKMYGDYMKIPNKNQIESHVLLELKM